MYAKFAIKFMIILRYLSVFSFLCNGADNLSSVEIFSIPKERERKRGKKQNEIKFQEISATYLSSGLDI